MKGGEDDRRVIAVAVVTLFGVGAASATYGPALPAIRSSFGVGIGESALVLTLHFLGALGGTLAFPSVARRATFGSHMRYGGLLILAGALAVGVAPFFAVVLGGALLLGMGQATVVTGFNFRLGRRPALVSAVNGVFGAGAMAGPLTVAALGGRYAPVYWLIAVLGLVTAALCPAEMSQDRPASPAADVAPRFGERAALAGFALLFFCYPAVEGGVGGWQSTYLVASGASAAAAAMISGLFWAAYTASRLAIAPIYRRTTPGALLSASVMFAAVAAGVPVVAPRFASAGWIALGALLGPVFPAAVSWFTTALPASAAAGRGALLFAAMWMGSVMWPAAIGAATTHTGAHAIPAVVFACSVVLAGVVFSVRAALRRAPTSESLAATVVVAPVPTPATGG